LCREVRVTDPVIVAVSESWANECIGDLKLDGYTLFRKDRALEVKEGGVLLYVKEKFNASEVKLQNQFPEQVWCKMSCSVCSWKTAFAMSIVCRSLRLAGYKVSAPVIFNLFLVAMTLASRD